ncbi:MAG: DnaJ domain-containing protein [Prevotella sp.]|nr:DnaJ domain-containing protein [Prevotella sp.]
MAFIDYYKILGVPKDIAQKDVKKAYLKRAKQFHPDLHPDDQKAKAKFQALNEAYDVIGDPEKRRKYDQYGEQWREADQWQQGGGGFHSGGGSPFEGFDFSSFQGGGGFSSFFENLFGGGFTGGRSSGRGFSGFGGSQPPTESQAQLDIDLYTALLGGEVVVSLGSGEKLRLKVKPCTQPGTKVRLRGKGQGGTDLILTFNVKLPTSLTPHQQELVRQMQIS